MDLFNKFNLFNDLYLMQVAYLSLRYSLSLLIRDIQLPDELMYTICCMVRDNLPLDPFRRIYGKVSIPRKLVHDLFATQINTIHQFSYSCCRSISR